MIGARMIVMLALLLAACGNTPYPPPRPRPALQAMLAEKKFQPSGYYMGADTPEDQKPLQEAVDSAIRDIAMLPDPLDKEAVRARLARLLSDVDSFATEDRDQTGRYAIRIWHAVGFREESRLFPMPDAKVMANP
jgi:hypothetical protein